MNGSRIVIDVAGPRRGGAWFALPWMVGMIAWTLLPMAWSAAVSFASWDGLTLSDSFRWVGLRNYRDLLGYDQGRPRDPLFYKALTNTLYYALIAVPCGVAFSLAVAGLLHRRFFGIGLFRWLAVLPTVLGGVVTSLVWSWLFNPQFGPVNACLRFVYRLVDPLVRSVSGADGIPYPLPDWFYSPAACKPALVLMHLWAGGGTMLIFLAALHRVPQRLGDAALLDGAGAWSRWRHVTLPHLSPIILFNLVTGFVLAMQTFDRAYLLYNRAQDDGLLFVMLHLYRAAFEAPYRLGAASAMAWILFAVIAAVVAPLLWLAKRWIHEVAG